MQKLIVTVVLSLFSCAASACSVSIGKPPPIPDRIEIAEHSVRLQNGISVKQAERILNKIDTLVGSEGLVKRTETLSRTNFEMVNTLGKHDGQISAAFRMPSGCWGEINFVGQCEETGQCDLHYKSTGYYL